MSYLKHLLMGTLLTTMLACVGVSEMGELVKTSNQKGQEWSYTSITPGVNWQAIDYDDSGWQKGNAGFGTSGTPGAVVGTQWNGKKIWLRKSFEITAIPEGYLFLDCHHDDEAEVYLNGKLLKSFAGYTSEYKETFLAPTEKSALKVGKNVLAVYCRQHSGGQYIDAGLIVKKEVGETLKCADFVLKAVPAEDGTFDVQCIRNGEVVMHSPKEGLWSLATEWSKNWPAKWVHGKPTNIKTEGPWLILSGEVKHAKGTLIVSDSYRAYGNYVKCVRRFTWKGQTLNKANLAIRWIVPETNGQIYMPSNFYYGNKSGARFKNDRVPRYDGKIGEKMYFEEHRYPMPFTSVEQVKDGKAFATALHSIPSRVPFANYKDQWWSLGVTKLQEGTELALHTGAVSINGKDGYIKANQRRVLPLPEQTMTLPNHHHIIMEKSFFLEVTPDTVKGSTFIVPTDTSLKIFKPTADDMPEFAEILEAKVRFSNNRWKSTKHGQGYAFGPGSTEFVFGWCGQCAGVANGVIMLNDYIDDKLAMEKAVLAVDTMCKSPFNKHGFFNRFNSANGKWYEQNPLSQAQGMENVARAIISGRKKGLDTSKWEEFLKKACDFHAARILKNNWHPVSTNEGFHISPLCKAYILFKKDLYKKAAVKAAEHYAERHLDMTEPYWGGTLDASCEDKEGAWAGFQGFLAVYEMTNEERYLKWAKHAMYVTLSYTFNWDVDFQASRLNDHALKTRGWTAVSIQNQHLDVYGVLYTPEIYRMAEYLKRDDLKDLALLMFRSCGQMIDVYGSQGEQLQHTNFVQWGRQDDISWMRGSYHEGWTPMWIASHFINAAAEFKRMGVIADQAEGIQSCRKVKNSYQIAKKLLLK